MQRGQEPGAGTGRAGSGDRDAPGAGTGTCRRKSAGAGTGAETGQRGREAGGRAPERGQERKRLKERREASGGRKAAGERAPEVTENDVVLPRKGSIPVRQCPRAACSPATPLRQLPPPLRRDATPSAHRPAVYYHSALPLRQLPPPLRRDATPSAHRPAALHHPSLHTSANFPSPAPPRGLFLPRSARSCSLPEGPKRPPAGPGTGSHRPNTHNRPIARTRTKKERHPLPDAAPWNGCAASTRGRRPYRPLRAGRRTRPAYWPQSTPR